MFNTTFLVFLKNLQLDTVEVFVPYDVHYWENCYHRCSLAVEVKIDELTYWAVFMYLTDINSAKRRVRAYHRGFGNNPIVQKIDLDTMTRLANL